MEKNIKFNKYQVKKLLNEIIAHKVLEWRNRIKIKENKVCQIQNLTKHKKTLINNLDHIMKEV